MSAELLALPISLRSLSSKLRWALEKERMMGREREGEREREVT